MKRYTLQPTPDRPQPVLWEIHEPDCDCPHCEPERPSYAPRLTALEIGRIAFWAVMIAHVIAVLIWGPRTVAHVLWCDLTGARL